MHRDRFRDVTVVVCVAALTLGPVVNPLLAQTSPVTGRIAGNVTDEATGRPIEGARVEAKLVTENAVFTGPATDGLGGYLVTGVPAGIYALSVVHDGATYSVAETVDVRMATTFLLEACFELDQRRGAASLKSDCSSGLYAENQLVSLGAHRYFREAGGIAPAQQIFIDHDAVTCIRSDLHSLVLAGIDPNEFVAVGRVFFRAPPHLDYYYVDMQTAGSGFQAILPRPAPETREFVYYIEAIDTSSDPVQTQEFTVLIDDCDEDPEAAYYQGDDPGIVVGSAIAGASMTPPGFLPTGISTFISSTGAVIPFAAGTGAVAASTGGGLSTLGVVLIVAAAGGVTSAVILSSTDENEGSPIN